MKKGKHNINHHSNNPSSAPKPKPGRPGKNANGMNSGQKDYETPSLKKGANVKGNC